jgi:hypothetical protein
MVMQAIGFTNNKLTGWSVVEDAVSLDRDSTTGGFSEYSLEGAGYVEASGVMFKEIMLDSPVFGRTHAFVRSITNTPWSWSATLNDPFYRLDVTASVSHLKHVPIDKVVAHVFKAAGATPPKVYIAKSTSYEQNPFLALNSGTNAFTFIFPGGKGNLWTILKSFLSANNYQITWIYDTIVLFENHTVLTRFQGHTADYSLQWAVSEPFSHIECTYYPPTRRWLTSDYPSGHKENGDPRVAGEDVISTVYPQPSDNKTDVEVIKDAEVMSVEAGETKEFILEIQGTLDYIYSQPECVMPSKIVPWLNIRYTEGANGEVFARSVYCVVGKDNKPITPAQWRAEGGSLKVEKGDEANQIKVTVTGMSNERLAPFRIAESDGQNDYCSLRIHGHAYLCEHETITFYTGYPYKTEPLKIDSMNITNKTQAYDACVYAAQKAFGYSAELEWTGKPPLHEAYTNVVYDFEREPVYLSDVNAFTGAPLPEKAAEKWPRGTTMKKIMDDLLEFTKNKAVVSNQQVFGRIAGTTAVYDAFTWHIQSASYDESSVKASCEALTRVSDVATIFDRPRVADYPLERGMTLRELTLKGVSHSEAQSAPAVAGMGK